MRIITPKRLSLFWETHPNAEMPLRSWRAVVKKAAWQTLVDVQADFPHADLVGDCVVFNVGGNNYRLVVKIKYRSHCVYIRKVMTHKEYDREKWKDDCNCKK